MKRVLKERDRLLRRLTGIIGIPGALFIAACTLVPVGLPVAASIWCLVLALLAAGLLGLYTARGEAVFAVLAVGAAIGVSLVAGAQGPAGTALEPLAATVVGVAGGVVAASVAVPFVVQSGILPVGSLAVATLAATAAPLLRGRAIGEVLLVVLICWIALALLGRFLEAAAHRATAHIAEVGRAHLAERHASEREAQLRQDARVLHDTVLATLSLLAHSGVGVSPDSLRQQAGEDARLLRQLRLGLPLGQASPAFFSPEADDGDVLGQTFELVRQRFGRMGLDVDWHGAGKLMLPRDTLDALIGALAECLENVRRHSGANRADVTITDDDQTVRAMVTDEGVGFDSSGVTGERLGFAESVVGRLQAVGGRARVFSSPGSGTTVMLEVPKP